MRSYTFLCLVFIASNTARSMDPAPPLKAFELDSLKKYVMADDDSLMRVVFPEETFQASDLAMACSQKSVKDLFSKKPPIISYNELYKTIFLSLRTNWIKPLQNQWLSTHRAFHEFIVNNALGEALNDLEKNINLGNIEDPNSKLRALMKEYVDFLFAPLKELSSDGGKGSPFDADRYSSDTRCPSWLSEHINMAIEQDDDFVAFKLCLRLDEIKVKINDLMTGEMVNKITLITLNENGYNHAIDSLVESILFVNKIYHNCKNYSDLKIFIRQTLVDVFKTNIHGFEPGNSQLYISDDVFYSELWKNEALFFSSVIKPPLFSLAKTKSSYVKVNTVPFTEIARHILENR